MYAPRLKSSLAATLALTLALGSVALRPGMVAAQATEPDNDTDAYDQTTCQGVSEDDVPDTSHTSVVDPGGKTDLNGGSSQDLGNDNKEFSPFPKNNFWPTFTSGGNNNNISFTPSYTAQDKALANDSHIPEPAVSFSQTGDAVPGQGATVMIQARNFSGAEVPGNQLYFASWLDGKYVNGITAGGDQDAYDQQTVVQADSARPDCSVIGRKVHTDNDHDGMDDGWELAHGLNPNDPNDAGLDPDKDGYVANAFPTKSGDLLNPAPKTAGGILGDGSFTNLEEFILGTDPNKADTDGDGYMDEQDAVGLGQNVVQFTATKSPVDGPYVLHSIVVGLLEKKDDKGNRLAKIDSSVYQLQQHPSDNLQVQLQVVNPAVKAGEVLQVQAQPTGSKTPDLLSTYNWSVNGVLQTALSGQSRRTLRYTVPDGTRPGTTFQVGVEVVDPQNTQLARGRTAITSGDIVLLSYDPENVEIGVPIDVQATLSSGLDPAQHLFLWSVDDLDLTTQSRIGADTLTWTPTADGGETQHVAVRVLNRDSKQIGSVEQEILVQPPRVQLTFTPAAPVAGQKVIAQAAAVHFGQNTLTYQFTVDGQAVPPVGPAVQFSAGADGTTHTVVVNVQTVGESAVAASATASFTTLPGGTAYRLTGSTGVAGNGRNGPRLLAQVVSTQQGTGYVALSAVVALGLGTLLAVRTKRGLLRST